MVHCPTRLVVVSSGSTSSHSWVEESLLELRCFVVGSGAMPQTPTATPAVETTPGGSSSLDTMTPT